MDIYNKENERFIEFNKAFIEEIKIDDPFIVVKKDINNIEFKFNKKSVVILNTDDILKHCPESKKDNYALVLSQISRSTKPEAFSLNDTLVFEYKDKKLRYESKNEINKKWVDDFRYTYLLRMDYFFCIRNANNLINKFRDNNFSEIDHLILGRINIDNNEKIIESRSNEGLDKYQYAAYKSSVSESKYTIIKGPPGTGKTYTAAKIASKLIKDGERVIFASAVHSSLDSLINKINDDQSYSHIRIWRSSFKAFSSFPKNYSEEGMDANLLVTTLASYKVNDMYPSSDSVLVIDESSTVSFFDVLSKTSLAKKIIIIGDDRQHLPIPPNKRIEQRLSKKHKNEFDVFFKKSLFESLYINNHSYELRNNYRSQGNIVKIVNNFYNNLNSVKKAEKNHIRIIQFDSFNKLMNNVVNHVKNNNIDFLCTTYFKTTRDALNEKLRTNGLKQRFITSRSIQGLEADEIAIVITGGINSIYQFDFRNINVLLSRAKKKINIFYTNNEINNKLIDSKKNSIEFKVKGSSKTLTDILNTK